MGESNPTEEIHVSRSRERKRSRSRERRRSRSRDRKRSRSPHSKRSRSPIRKKEYPDRRMSKSRERGSDRRRSRSRRDTDRKYRDDRKRSYSRDRKYSRDDRRSRDDKYSKDDKYSRDSRQDKYSKDDKYSRDDRYSKDDKYSKEDKYSKDDKYSRDDKRASGSRADDKTISDVKESNRNDSREYKKEPTIENFDNDKDSIDIGLDQPENSFEPDIELLPPKPKSKESEALSEEELKRIAEEEKKKQRRERLAQWKSKKITIVPQFTPLPMAHETEPSSAIPEPTPVSSSHIAKLKPFIQMKTTITSRKIKLTNSQSSLAFQLEESETEDDINPKVASIQSQLDQPSTAQQQSIEQSEEQLVEEEEEDALDLYMNDVDEEVEKLNSIYQEPEIQLDFSQFDQEEEIFMPEERTLDLRSHKEIAVDLDDPDAILAPYVSKFATRKKDFVTIDHENIEYTEFRRDFWVEPPDLSDMTEEEIEIRRIELDNIKIRGLNCPKPVSRWTQCGLSHVVFEVIKNELKFKLPTPIQAQAIPAIMSGRDIMGVAKTGSGKTIAFLLPLLRHVKDQPTVTQLQGPIALIMTPTRELALQIFRECKHFTKALNLRACCVYGGAPIKDQISELKRGAEIVICTPGRILDLLTANNGRVINLKRITFLVLDEADRMFDLGFEPQVMRIVMNVRPDSQKVLFSATFPRQMEALARKILRNPVEIIIGGRSVVCKDVKQHVQVIHEDHKFVRLLEILGKTLDDDPEAKILIFVDKHEAADNVLKDLLRRGYPCQALHGAQDQADRDSTILDFKQGNTLILIATSVAARGLDVKQLKVVVNYECPNHLEDYVHRVGRTGRAGMKGESYTFLTPDQDKYAVDIIKALKMSKTPIPEDLQSLGERFLEKVKEGTSKKVGSGYGGKGLERLEQDRNAKKAIQKTTHTAEALAEALEEEEDKEESQDGNSFSLAKAKEVNAGMNSTGKTTLKANAGSMAYEIEINDFPQQARWYITSKEAVEEISILTGAAITVRGSFVPTNKQPKYGEKKLYLYIEGHAKEVIDRAKTEVRRALNAATLSSFEQGGGSQVPFSSAGRYSVV